MHAENWKNIKDVLLEALSLDASERRHYLEAADISFEVREEVKSLLAFEQESKDLMHLSAVEFSKGFFAADNENTLIGQKVGVYEIVSELGIGGMGAVYLATRIDGKFEQRVAIKLLKRELNIEKIRRNFAREKEILATLAHPNIATLLDAGTTDDGIPYLVMEYIEGVSVDEFCRSRNLSLTARLKLFNKVCEAVAFAHRNLIIHRDLKPSNILVTADGEPKLLDFGISKLLDAKTEDANITNIGAMTPQYASPEQLKGEPVTTATDVYSLGVVLFKILTGTFPYHSKNKTNGTLLGDTTQLAPTLPSEAALRSDRSAVAGGLFTSQKNPPATAERSDLSPVSPSELKGDLDNIILKSLCGEPERRYQTVEQFCADIWRFVDGLPVLARPAAFSYRASKFYQRNKVSVAAAALILISLCAGIAVALTQAGRATAQARIAVEQRDAAQRASARAERTSRFMQSFLEYANPLWYGRGKGRYDITVREAIDDAATRIDTELADEPEVRADLHYTLGIVYSSHGENEVSFRHMRQSLDLYRQAYGEQHPKVARGLYYVSMGMYREGENEEEVMTMLRQGIAIMRQTEPENVNLPYMLQQLANWIMKGERRSRNRIRLAEAESLILELRPLFIRHYGENHIATITADGSLTTLAFTRGDFVQAESMREKLLARYRQAGESDYSYIWALTFLGETKLALGKQSEAETLFAQSLELGGKYWGANDFRLKQLIEYISQVRAAARV